MKVVGRYLIAQLAWATGLSILMVAIGALGSGPLSAADALRWISRGIALAGFPAAIITAPAVFGDAEPWRPLLRVVVAATIVSIVVVLIGGIVAPAFGEPQTSFPRFYNQMGNAAASWETRNDAAWRFYTTIFGGVNAWLFAAIGLQLGAWAAYSLPRSLHRPLYWAVGIGLLITGLGIADTTYETIILHTQGDASIAAFYTLLLPLSVCAGLGLPTLALLRRADIPRNVS